MTDNKKWFDERFGEGDYDRLVASIETEIKSFPWTPEEDIDPELEEEYVNVRLRVHEGSLTFITGDIQFDTDARGKWGYSSFVRDSKAEDVVEELVSELHEAYSDIEDWADIDIDFVESQIDGKPYVIYIRTGSVPNLEVQSLHDWNKEDLDYDDDNEEEDFRIRPHFHIAEPRTPLEDALKAYRKYLEDEGLSYLLED